MDPLQDLLTATPCGCVTSLNPGHAFDSMDPKITVAVLRRINLTPRLADFLFIRQSQQQRFIQFDNTIHDQTLLAGFAMLQ